MDGIFPRAFCVIVAAKPPSFLPFNVFVLFVRLPPPLIGFCPSPCTKVGRTLVEWFSEFFFRLPFHVFIRIRKPFLPPGTILLPLARINSPRFLGTMRLPHSTFALMFSAIFAWADLPLAPLFFFFSRIFCEADFFPPHSVLWLSPKQLGRGFLRIELLSPPSTPLVGSPGRGL